MKKIMGYMRKAIDEYNMIENGDNIAIGVSGGKDSLTLLMGLKGLQRYYPKKFHIEALTLSMGFDDFDLSGIQKLCKEIDVPYNIIDTKIAKIIFDVRKESNPCSLCTKMRKGALHKEALKLGCKKFALGHHFEDTIETFFMSLFYEGRFSCFSPVTYLDRSDITLIRPMIYIPEQIIKGFSTRYNLPIVKNPCPEDGHTKREYIKNLINNLSKEDNGLKDRIFGAIKRSGIENW